MTSYILTVQVGSTVATDEERVLSCSLKTRDFLTALCSFTPFLAFSGLVSYICGSICILVVLGFLLKFHITCKLDSCIHMSVLLFLPLFVLVDQICFLVLFSSMIWIA